MRDLLVPGLVVAAYMAVLVGVALWGERLEARGRRVAHNPLVYSLSLAVYATTWTFYGSVGFAARKGLLFLTVYLGPTLVFAAAWWLLRPLIRLKDERRITGLPDLLSLRYGKSRAVALVATLVLVVGLVPYIALQLKTMLATLALLTAGGGALAYPAVGARLGPPLVALLLLFTIVVGLRRVSPAERHPGLVLALAIESAVKLVAFLAVGAFVVWGLFDGPREIFRVAAERAVAAPSLLGGEGVVTWMCHLLVSAVAVVLLPRQFHVTVVENAHVSHLRTAMWLFPAYLLAINVFVLPLALGALALGGSAESADTFVLALPLEAGQTALSWAVFLGGFSAGLGMVVAETTALSTMISNDVVAPAAEAWAPARALRRHLVPTRWVAAALVLAAAYAYERAFGTGSTLASIGFISFAAVMQLAPALVGGLLWSGASRAGAIAGISAGALTWAYTVVVPVLARSGWLPASILDQGPFGIEALAPEGLFDLHLDPVSHTVVWSLILNAGAFFAGSFLRPPRAQEIERGRALAARREGPAATLPASDAPPLAPAAAKRRRAEALLASYFGEARAAELVEACLREAGAADGRDLTALQIAELESRVEAALSAAIGSAGAHAAVRRSGLVSEEEAGAISKAYGSLLASMHVSPAELKRRVDYHRERERLLARDAAHQRFLADVSEGLGASLDPAAIAQTAVRLAVPDLADAALLFVPASGFGVPRATFAHVDAGKARVGRVRAEVALDALARAPPVVGALELRRTAPSPRPPAGWPPGLEEVLPGAAQLVLPLAVNREALGVLALFADEARQLSSPDHVALAEALARRIAVALENARLYRGAEDAVQARDRFLAVASHELKTPLTPLRIRINALERLVSRGALEHVPRHKLVALFSGAEGQVVRMARLVDDLLDVTRMSLKRFRVSPEPMDLRQSAAEVIERHRAEIVLAGCVVRLEAPGPVAGTWDRLRLEQVITNLLTNALKYAPRSPVEVRIEADEAQARVMVRDAGPGIAPEDQARIFRPFERATSDRTVGGFGLGLFIVREIVEAHGGALTLRSAPGEGAAFVAELPRVTPARA